MNILMLLNSSVDNDSRVKKEIETLGNAGHSLALLSVNGCTLKHLRRHIVISHKNKRRLLPGVALMISHFKFIKAALTSYTTEEAVHCHDLNTLLPGVLIKWLNKGVKVVYDSHEFAINDVPNESWWSIKLKYLLERFLIRFADEVIVVSESIAAEYARLYNIKKPHLVLNCPPYIEQPKRDLFRQTLGIRPDQVIFLYQGGLSQGRGIETLLQAFEQRHDDRCVLVCMGYGPLETMVNEFAKRSSLIFYHQAVQHSALLNYTSSADFGVSLIEDSCISYRYCLPNKLFEYLMAGLPVIVSDLVEMRRLVLSESIGLVVKSGSTSEFKTAVDKMLAMDRKQTLLSVHRARKKYCWETQERMLKIVYCHLR
jgi:glycosyltransferase involved in cell wall biosynthesis